MKIDLVGLVVDKINRLGLELAAEYFAVTTRTLQNWRDDHIIPAAEACQKVLDEYTACEAPETWDLKGKKAVILMPVYRAISCNTLQTMIRCWSAYGRDSLGLIIRARTLIWEARSQLAMAALKTDSQQFIFLDDDSVLPCGNAPMLDALGCDIAIPMAAKNSITELLAAPEDKLIVSALAFARNGKQLRAACSEGMESPGANEVFIEYKTSESMEFRPQRWVGMAFTRVHRSVFERMIAAADTELPEIKPSAPGRHYGFFTPLAQDQGEDAAFSIRAKKIGIDSFLACGIPIGHEGTKIY